MVMVSIMRLDLFLTKIVDNLLPIFINNNFKFMSVLFLIKATIAFQKSVNDKRILYVMSEEKNY
jgi:hypothetical protein